MITSFIFCLEQKGSTQDILDLFYHKLLLSFRTKKNTYQATLKLQPDCSSSEKDSGTSHLWVSGPQVNKPLRVLETNTLPSCKYNYESAQWKVQFAQNVWLPGWVRKSHSITAGHSWCGDCLAAGKTFHSSYHLNQLLNQGHLPWSTRLLCF